MVDDDHVRTLYYYIILWADNSFNNNYRYRYIGTQTADRRGGGAVGRRSAARVRVFAASNITKTGFAENEHHAVAAAGSKPVKTEGRRDGDTCAHTRFIYIYNIIIYNMHVRRAACESYVGHGLVLVRSSSS